MKMYEVFYDFDKNRISYKAIVDIEILEDVYESKIGYYEEDYSLDKGFAETIVKAVVYTINNWDKMLQNAYNPDKVEKYFNKTTVKAELLHSYFYNSYAVIIGNKLYPIVMDLKIEVASDPFEFLE